MDSSFTLSVATVSSLLLGASILLLVLRRIQARPLIHATKTDACDVKDERPVVRICFGTQTGTAEKFSKQLASKMAELYTESTRVEVVDMEQYDHKKYMPTEGLIIFILATYGDGEPTDNSILFFNWLVKASEDVMNGDIPEICKGLSYGVFGLGNRQYEHFNTVGKAVHKHLKVIGGSPLLRVGLGDDDVDIADDFEVWTDEFLKALDESSLLQKTESCVDARPLEGYTVKVHPPGAVNGLLVTGAVAGQWGGHNVTPARTALVRELHSTESERSCVHVEIDITGTGLAYDHGDHVAVFASNSDDTVDEASRLLGLDPELVFELNLPDGNPERLSVPLPCPTTLRTALRMHADLLNHPDKHALEALASCAGSKDEAEKLRALASHEGKAEYASYVVAAQRSLLQVMSDFPSCKPSLGLFFGHIAGRLQPRYYSISSSPLLHPQSIHITVAVVDEVGPSGRRHQGVASTWLANCKEYDTIPIFLRRSTFKLPKEVSTPIIMVGPGTGLAPFRGFLQHRAALQKCGDILGEGTLFFGCRHPNKDFIYQEELQTFQRDRTIGLLDVAFSRLLAEKEYVQHRLHKQGKTIYELLEQDATLYVCGDAKHMAKDVHRALHEVVKEWGQCGNSEAESYVKNLQMNGRYLQDVW